MPAKRKTSKGRIFTRGASAVWYCQYYIHPDGDTKLQQKVVRLLNAEGLPCANRKEAEAARDRLLAPLAMKDRADQLRTVAASLADVETQAAALVAAAKPKLPLCDLWNRHPYTTNTRGSAERTLSPATVKDNIAQWDKLLSWAAGEGLRFAEDVTPGHAKAFRQALAAEGLSGDRQNKIVGLCKVMFRAAEIAPNPFEGLRKQSHVPQGRRELTGDELRAICQAAEGELRTLFAIGVFTGLRLKDAATLRWDEIAPDLSKITRLPSKTAYKGKALVVPVHSALAAILAETPRSSRVGFVLPETGPKYLTAPSDVSKAIQDHIETTCNIRTHRPGTGKGTDRRASVEVGYHSLRHSFVSVCAREGVPLHVVQALVGHASPEIQQRYLHASNADTSKAIASLPTITGPEAEPAEAAARTRLARLIKTATPDQVGRMLAILGE